MSFPKKTVKVHDSDVEVHCVKIGEKPAPVYKFTATIGDTVYEHTLTVGAASAEFIHPTAEQLQKDVDAARDYAAKHAHSRHAVKNMESQIK